MAGAPEGRASRALAWCLRAGGLAIGLVQCIYLPVTGQADAVNPVAIALAAALAGVAEGVVRDARRRR